MTQVLPTPATDPLGKRVEAAFREYRRELVGLARVLTGSPARAEEVVQEAFVSLHRFVARVEPGNDLAYLRRAVTNQARSGWRRRDTAARHLHEVGSDPVDRRSPADQALSSTTRSQVDAALRQLSDRQRACLALTYFAELSVAEIAETLDISEGSVKTHLHRGRAALAPLLEELR